MLLKQEKNNSLKLLWAFNQVCKVLLEELLNNSILVIEVIRKR